MSGSGDHKLVRAAAPSANGSDLGETRRSCWRALRADTHRQYGRYTFGHLLKGAVASRTFRVVFTMRLCQGAASSSGILRLALPFFRALHRIATNSASMDFPWRTQVGAGLALTHGWGLVVTDQTRIGNNVTLFHGVTLGRRDRISPDQSRLIGYPVLEDEVWVGPHAVIVGGVTIGRGSRIAAGAFVTTDVPPYSVVVGNPAVIVRRDCTPDVRHPAPL